MPTPGTAAYDAYQAHRSRKGMRKAMNAQYIAQGLGMALPALGAHRRKAEAAEYNKTMAQFLTGDKPLTREGISEALGQHQEPNLVQKFGNLLTAPFGRAKFGTQGLPPEHAMKLYGVMQGQQGAKQDLAYKRYQVGRNMAADKRSEADAKRAEQTHEIAMRKGQIETRADELYGEFDAKIGSPRALEAAVQAAGVEDPIDRAATLIAGQKMSKSKGWDPKSSLERSLAARGSLADKASKYRLAVDAYENAGSKAYNVGKYIQDGLMVQAIGPTLGWSDAQMKEYGVNMRKTLMKAALPGSTEADKDAAGAVSEDAQEKLGMMWTLTGQDLISTKLISQSRYGLPELPSKLHGEFKRLNTYASKYIEAKEQGQPIPPDSVPPRGVLERMKKELRDAGLEAEADPLFRAEFDMGLDQAIKRSVGNPSLIDMPSVLRVTQKVLELHREG